ncbi:MAG: HipA N-terminal domain-containing protein [Mangrovibacterium sp.]
MRNMLKKIAKAIWHTEGMDERVTPDDLQAQFTLSYNKLVIGYLSINQGKWVFEYSEEFKKQGEILPLSNFPNKELVYKSDELWPFFATRIPSAAQLERKTKVNDLAERDEVNLLRKYGHRTITNPFVLQPEF